MFGNDWGSWLLRNVPDLGTHAARRRRRGLASGLVSQTAPAEILETRVLLSAAAIHLVFQVQPANTTAGTSFSVTVAVEDSSGSVVTTNDSTIRLALREPGRFAGDGNTMTATAVDGVATFDSLTLDKAGTYTLEASTGRHRHGVRSDSFTIAPDTSGPLTVNSGPTMSFDSSTPSPYTVSTENGVARFNDAILDTAGSYTLAATDSNSAVTMAVSDSITIRAHGHDDANGRDGGNGPFDGDGRRFRF